MSRTIVVVGAGLAGLRASEQLRAAGWDESIMVVGDEQHPPYNRPPLTKLVLTDGLELEKLHYPQRASTADVEWRLGVSAVSADLDAHQVSLSDGTSLSYDGLVIATGVSSHRLPLDAPTSWRHAIRTYDDAQALRKELVPGARVVIIGGGFIGCEVAAAAQARGAAATIVEPFSTPLAGPVGTLVGAEVQRRHVKHGVTFHLGRTVALVDGTHEGPTAVRLDDGTVLPADVVVEAVGTKANTDWLAGQGLDLSNGVLCDGNFHPLRDDEPVAEVVALGDVARFPIPMYGGQHFRIEHWSTPGDTAGHAARSLVAGVNGVPVEGPAFNPVPSFWSDQYGTRIQSFGIPSLGLDDVRVLEGALESEGVVGFHRDGRLVGLVLFGMSKRMLHYRGLLIEQAAELSEGVAR